MNTICIIDDEPNIIELARMYLERDGFRVISSGHGNQGLEMINTESPDLIVLDIMLPDIDGLEVLKKIRQFGKIPVLMLSARKEDIDKIVGLELGADDYLTKPFNPHELLARVKAILRRSLKAADGDIIELGCLKIDTARHEVMIGNELIELRSREFSLLTTMARQPGVVFSREQLLNQVWGYDYYGDTRTVDVHINHLRAKLDGSGIEIETLRGTGYKMTMRKAGIESQG